MFGIPDRGFLVPGRYVVNFHSSDQKGNICLLICLAGAILWSQNEWMNAWHATHDAFIQGSGPTSILKQPRSPMSNNTNYNVTQRMQRRQSSQKKVKYKDTREWTSVWEEVYEMMGAEYNTTHTDLGLIMKGIPVEGSSVYINLSASTHCTGHPFWGLGRK